MRVMKRFLIVTTLFVLMACDSTSEETPPPSLTVSPTTLTLIVGESQQLDVMIDEEAATSTDVTFSSDAPDVASVDESGVVEAMSLGTATITVSLSNVMETVVVNVTEDITGATCQGDFTVTSQAELNALPDCAVIEGTLTIDDNADDVDDIEDLISLSELIQITNLHIANNLALTSLSGLENLTVVTGDLTIGGGPGQLQLAPGSLPFQGNPLITSLAGLNNLRTVGGDVAVFRNTELRSFTGLGNLEEVGGDFNVFDNYRLRSFVGLNALQQIGGRLGISANSSLVTLDGLQKLEQIGGSVYIGFNWALSSLNAIATLAPDDVGGDVEIFDNDTPCDIALCEVNNPPF